MELELRHINKIYPGEKRGQEVSAVKDFSLRSNQKEFLVFVGPSGCGKSTTLRMIAGLESITSGDLLMDGERMNDVEAGERNIAMVFQNYALYPHMTAYENMAFGLRNIKTTIQKKDKDGNPILAIDERAVRYWEKELKRLKKDRSLSEEEKKQKAEIYSQKLEQAKTTPVPLTKEVHYSKKEIDDRIHSAAKILGIESLLGRKPKAMSGGQRQRVALGRAMVRRPRLFLLDEPLSNLDAKLRSQMRIEITKLYQALDTTFIYVTHDQVEAMSMGDRIVVMRDGVIQQVDTPTALFDAPANRFVAGFLGTPQMNFFEINITRQAESLLLSFGDGQTLKFGLRNIRKIKEEYLDGKPHQAILGIRPEHFFLTSSKDSLAVQMTLKETLGSESLLYGTLGKESITIKTPTRYEENSGTLHVSFLPKNIHLFDEQDETSLLANASGEWVDAPKVHHANSVIVQ